MPHVVPANEADTFSFTVPVAPVSLQATGAAREVFRSRVRQVLAETAFLLCGDVQMHVEWFVSSRARYETDRTPDIDNILKPLIDALTGPAGVIVDDNQIHALSCGWVDIGSDEESLGVQLRFQAGEWFMKEGLCFVQFHGGLCLPIPDWKSPELAQQWFQLCRKSMSARREADEKGVPYSFAQMLMPRQRVFHRTRLAAFNVLPEAEYLAANGGAA